jgi:3'-phosphoadenosine 5'-phosphosulfate sulfotransferase (PAPS reductase)/FAD synthetase
MDEAAALAYCQNHGFDWGGLYKHFRRVSCYCCPLQRIGDIRTLRRHFPELWQQMLEWDRAIDSNIGFYNYDTVHDLERRFTEEDRQFKLLGA